jgi:hypothetical protein
VGRSLHRLHRWIVHRRRIVRLLRGIPLRPDFLAGDRRAAQRDAADLDRAVFRALRKRDAGRGGDLRAASRDLLLDLDPHRLSQLSGAKFTLRDFGDRHSGGHHHAFAGRLQSGDVRGAHGPAVLPGRIRQLLAGDAS